MIVTGVPLQEWMNDNLLEADNALLYKKAGIAQTCFIRDRIHYLFSERITEDRRYEWRQTFPVTVISSHRSKSVPLPVSRIELPGLAVVMRANFYDWKLSIEADTHVSDVFLSLFNKDNAIPTVYCEGFHPDWVFGSFADRASSPDGKERFTIELADDYALWTFIYLLLNEGIQ